MKKHAHFLTFLVFLFVTVFSFGQTDAELENLLNEGILSWDIPRFDRNEVLPSITTVPPAGERNASITNDGLEPSTLIRGEGLVGTGERARAFSAFGFSVEREDAFRDGDYFEFEIVPKEGNQVSLDTLIAKFTRSNGGPREFLWQYRLDVDCTFTDIGSSFRFDINEPRDPNSPASIQEPIILSTVRRLQNVSFPNKIVFRLYGWGSNGEDDEDEFFGFGRNPREFNDLTIKGEVSSSAGAPPIEPLEPAVWNGNNWENDIVPSPENQPTRDVVIARGAYNTNDGNISACNLTVNAGAVLIVSNNTYVEVVNNVNVNGILFVGSEGNFVQNSDSGTFRLGAIGGATVRKQTPKKSQNLHYTFWSSPVKNFSSGQAFQGVDADRRFLFDAANYLDLNNDNVPDDPSVWRIVRANENLIPGVGYAATSSNPGFFERNNNNGGPPRSIEDVIRFNGEFNTGTISVNIEHDARNRRTWNLIGNPYPSAINFDILIAENSDLIEGIGYFWSQKSPQSADNPGNDGLNFSFDDYVMRNGTGGIGVGGPSIPSGQSFFIAGLRDGQLNFTNAMRIADGNAPLLLKGGVKSKKSTSSFIGKNKLWINLISEKSIFNQILIGYVRGASNEEDELLFDAPSLSTGGNLPAVIYSRIENSRKKFAIQGRDIQSVANEDIVNLGFINSVNNSTVFRISIAKTEGNFLKTNNVYLKDNLLDITHNLSLGDYSFTAEQGEFTDRFQIKFKTDNVLSVKDPVITENNVTVSYLKNNVIEVNTNSDLNINSITLYDILGKQLTFSKQEISSRNQINLFNYKSGLYIVKIKLSDGSTVSKKIIR